MDCGVRTTDYGLGIKHELRIKHGLGTKHGLRYKRQTKHHGLGITAAWLTQLVERQSAVREVEGSSPGPDQHSES